MAINGPARIPLLTDAEMPDVIRNNKDLPKVNIFRALANHPDAFVPWNRFAAYVIGRSELSARQREILFLRTGWNHQSDYEFGQHRVIGKRAGLTDEEILNTAIGPDAPEWSAEDRVLLKAADALYTSADIPDDIWAELDKHYNDLQKLDVVIGVAQYTLVCMVLKTARVPLDDEIDGLPDIEGSRLQRGPYLRLDGQARIQPLSADDIEKQIGDDKDLQQLTKVIKGLDRINVVATLANHSKFYTHWNRFGAYVFNESELSTGVGCCLPA